MKKWIPICWLLCGGFNAFGAWLEWDVNTAVPDNDPTGLQDTRALSGFTDVIESVEVRLTFTAAPGDLAYNGDLYASLQHDTGFAVLLNRVGKTEANPLGYDNNGFDINFTLGGDDIHLYQDFDPGYDGQGRLVGTWGVDGRNVDPDIVLDTSPRTDMLASFTGLNPNGNWTIFVADMNPHGKATLDSWGLRVTVIPEPGIAGLFLVTALSALGVRRIRRMKRGYEA